MIIFASKNHGTLTLKIFLDKFNFSSLLELKAIFPILTTFA